MTLPLLLALSAGLAAAEPPARGYVVRVDAGTVWLDLTAADGAAAGRAFEIYAEGPELKHPVTGESLGRAETKVAEGEIAAVSEKSSSGRLSSGSAAVKPGQRARWAGSAPAPRAAKTGDAEAREPKTRGATLNYPVFGMAVGDFDGVGKPQVALAAEDAVRLYAYPVASAAPLAEAKVEGTGVRVLGLEAADLDGDGRAELFVSLFTPVFKRFETRVLKLESGKWLKAAELPFLVRAYQDAKGARILATQMIYEDNSFPLGKILPLVYKDGKYLQGSPAVDTGKNRWLYAFTTAQLGAANASIYVTPTHALRVQLQKGSPWRAPDDDYGQTPVRVRWGDRLFEFNPPLAATYGESGFDSLYALRNMAALGGFGSPFGLFNRGELLRQRWNGLGFDTVWRAALPGCAQGLAVVETAPGVREIVIALRGTADQSSVWTYAP